MTAHSTGSSTESKTKTGVFKFPLKGKGISAHPADENGAVADWATLYGVNVGPQHQPFVIHRSIVEKIPLLRQRLILRPDTKEALSGSLTLEDVDTLAFAVATDFAYTGHLDEDLIKQKYAQPDDDSDSGDEEREGTPQQIPTAPTDPNLALIDPAILQPHPPQPATTFTANDTKFSTSTSTSITTPKSEDSPEPPEDSIRPTFDNLLISTYTLAHTLSYPSLSNATITSYITHLSTDGIPSYWSLTHLQRNNFVASKMMKLMLRSIAVNVRREGWRFWEEADVGFVVWCREGVGNMGLVVGELAGDAGAGGNESGEKESGIGKGLEELTREEVCREWHVHVGGERCGKGKPKVVNGCGAGKKRKDSAGTAGGGGSTGAAKKVKK